MPQQMKGLVQFIIDLRNTKDLEEERRRVNLEVNNIQIKFNSNVNGYQKKKYLCKLLYIYLVGYTDMVDFGMSEAMDLMSSNMYSEKQLGYLTFSILSRYQAGQTTKSFLTEKLLTVYPYLISDLQSQNEEFNCLAIEFIGSNFKVSEEANVKIIDEDANSDKWLEIIDILYSLTISPIQNAFLRKKAVLAFLALVRLYPQVIRVNTNWIPRLFTLLDDTDLGVVISSVPLLQYIITFQPQYLKSLVSVVANRLYSLIIDNECPEEYYYYKSPAPWLIVRLLQMTESFFLLQDGEQASLHLSDINSQALNKLRQVVAKSIQNAAQPMKGLPNRNSQSAILFQSVSLAVFLEASPDAIQNAINALLVLLDSNECNSRYLSLDALIKLTARSSYNIQVIEGQFDSNLTRLFELLHDRDVSVKRKSLDLLYTICNAETCNVILNQLLEFFPLADYSLRSELAIKIAILAENFATDSIWYVTIMLKLLSIGDNSRATGASFIGNEVWERIAQIIVNNEDLHTKASHSIINLLESSLSGEVSKIPSESLVKVAAFVLGEFGYLVASKPNCSAEKQFELLYASYFQVSLISKAMILSSFLKMLINFPDESFVADIIDLFEVETQSLDLEIQSRAFEYLKLATLDSSLDLAKSVVRLIPPFENKENVLINRMGSVRKIINEKSTKGAVGAQNLNKAFKSSEMPLLPENDQEISSGAESEADPFQDKKEPAALTSGWYAGYHRMLNYDAGIFFENQLIKITYRILRDQFNITIKFTIVNSSKKTAGTDITALKVLNLQSWAKSVDPSYLIELSKEPDVTVHDKTNLDVDIKIRNVVENTENPILSLSFVCGGSYNQLNLRIPVVLLKTLSGTTLSNLEQFHKRWDQIGELLGIDQGQMSVNVSTTHRFTAQNVTRLLGRLGFTIVHEAQEEHRILIIGAGILHTQQSNYGVLCTLRTTDDIGKEFDAVVRCTGGGVAAIIASSLKEVFEGKY